MEGKRVASLIQMHSSRSFHSGLNPGLSAEPMDLKLFIEPSEGKQQSPIPPFVQHLTVLEKDLAFFLHKKVPKLELAHKDPLVGKLNYMSNHVESL